MAKTPGKSADSSDADKRRSRRVDAQVEVAFNTAEAYVVEYTKNISKGGIFLRTDRLPDPNSIIELKITLPDLKEPLSVMGRVARTVAVSDPDKPGEHLYGVGIYFIEWQGKAKPIFEEFYEKMSKKKSK